MGDQNEEAEAWNAIQRAETERQIREMERAAERERLQQQQEGGQSNMAAETPGQPVGGPWTEVSAQPEKPGLMSTVAGKLGVGAAGDLAFAKQLLDSERSTGAGADGAKPDGAKADGAKDRMGSAVGTGSMRPAFER